MTTGTYRSDLFERLLRGKTDIALEMGSSTLSDFFSDDNVATCGVEETETFDFGVIVEREAIGAKYRFGSIFRHLNLIVSVVHCRPKVGTKVEDF